MARRIDALLIGLALTGTLAACGGGGGGGYTPGGGGGGGGGNGGSTPPPVGANTIGVGLPSGMGTVTTAQFGVIGGYTQQTFSQVLAFAPGTQITIRNLSSSVPHTLNVLSTSSFPANPALSTNASGGNQLGANYASGTIAPGGSVVVTLATAGTYYIGCAYHYPLSPSMRDVLIVSNSATPGPQATPAPGSTSGSGGGYGGY